jgi:hypothetical protein
MAEAISKLFMKEAFPRVLKATVWGSVTFLVVYWLPMILYPTDILPIDYATPLFRCFRRRRFQRNVTDFGAYSKLGG